MWNFQTVTDVAMPRLASETVTKSYWKLIGKARNSASITALLSIYGLPSNIILLGGCVAWRLDREQSANVGGLRPATQVM